MSRKRLLAETHLPIASWPFPALPLRRGGFLWLWEPGSQPWLFLLEPCDLGRGPHSLWTSSVEWEEL